jgi:hypothetical protein
MIPTLSIPVAEQDRPVKPGLWATPDLLAQLDLQGN